MATRGWLFPLKGGAADGYELRLPYLRNGDNTAENLPEEICVGLDVYVLRPALLKDGRRKQASYGKGQKIDAWEYAIVQEPIEQEVDW